MIYKTFTISLFTAGTALAAIGLTSVWHEIGWEKLITDEHWAEAGVDGGNIRIALARRTSENPTRWGVGWPLGWLGRFGVYGGVNRNQWRYGVLILPLWALVGLFFIHPGVALIRGPVRRRLRRRRSQCVHCGYDLTGNITGICSECGKPFAAAGDTAP